MQFFDAYLPKEIEEKILDLLNYKTLGRISNVSREGKRLADVKNKKSHQKLMKEGLTELETYACMGDIGNFKAVIKKQNFLRQKRYNENYETVGDENREIRQLKSQYQILKLALKNGSLKVVKYLIEDFGFGEEIYDIYYKTIKHDIKDEDSILTTAARSGSAKLLIYLMEELEYDFTWIKYDMLILAAASEDIEAFNYLCKKITDSALSELLTIKNEDGKNIIDVLYLHGHFEVANKKLLICSPLLMKKECTEVIREGAIDYDLKTGYVESNGIQI